MSGRRYSGRSLSNGRGYTTFVPGDPSPVDLDPHRLEQGHRIDTSGRDEAPRGGGWLPSDATAEPAAGLRSTGNEDDAFRRSHQRYSSHDQNVPGGNAAHVNPILAFLRGYFPKRPNDPATIETAGAAGAAHGGQRDRGMDPSSANVTRRTVDGRMRNPGTPLGHTYTHPIERVRRPLHFNRPRLRRVLMPSITVERGSSSPGGYSSQYNPISPAKTVGPRNPVVRRLIKPLGQADADEVSQAPGMVARHNPGPIGNGGW